MEQKITAGRDELGGFAPKFAQLNDDVLFGEVWAREEALSARDRSIVTVTALMAGGILDSSLKFHIANAKRHGVTAGEMAEILTHAAFYAGWPKAGPPCVWRRRSTRLTAGGPGISLGLLPRHGHEMTAHGPGPPHAQSLHAPEPLHRFMADPVRMKCYARFFTG